MSIFIQSRMVSPECQNMCVSRAPRRPEIAL